MISTENKEWNGRYANRLLVNFGYSQIAQMQTAYVEYNTDFLELGIQFYMPTHPKPDLVSHTVEIDFQNHMSLMVTPVADSQCTHFKRHPYFYFQTPEVAHTFYNHIRNPHIRDQIVGANPFRDRYDANNDVFVHVRLGDIAHQNPGLAYYTKCLDRIPFDCGYISTDSPNHPDIQELQKRFGLKLIDYDETRTLQFASTCKFLILSHGTFSWAMGAFAFNGSVHYPKIQLPFFQGILNRPWTEFHWHGDMFVFDDWQCVSTN